MENIGNVSVKDKKNTIAEKSQEIGKMLEEAMDIMSDIGVKLIGDGPIEEKRPDANCLLADMDLNESGMRSLLLSLRRLKEILF